MRKINNWLDEETVKDEIDLEDIENLFGNMQDE